MASVTFEGRLRPTIRYKLSTMDCFVEGVKEGKEGKVFLYSQHPCGDHDTKGPLAKQQTDATATSHASQASEWSART